MIRLGMNYWQRMMPDWYCRLTDNRSEDCEAVEWQSWLMVLTVQLIGACGRILRLWKGALRPIGSPQRNADGQAEKATRRGLFTFSEHNDERMSPKT
jgi:hypothetical protein